MISSDQIKELREQTGVSVMQCRKALEEAGGDKEKAILILKKKSRDIALKKSDRVLGAGTVQSYIHGNGSVGVLVHLASETDFVAKNEDFKKLAYDIAMHVAASSPEYLKPEDISPEMKQKVYEMFKRDVAESNKDTAMKEKIISGKMESYFAEQTLLNQPFIKNPEMTIAGLINEAVQKFGEKIEIVRFVRLSL